MNKCKKYRIKKGVNRRGFIYYVAQKRTLWIFWSSVFGVWDTPEHTRPKYFWDESEVKKELNDYIRIKQERKEAYLAAKKEIKNNKYICVD